MPAPVRSACARAALRRFADQRPSPTSRTGPPLSRRQQIRHFRFWSSSPWDPDHARRHRALWQRYAKLRGDVWGPQWGLPHAFPPLMREMQKFEKWVRELEAQLDPPQGVRKTRFSPQSFNWRAGHGPSRWWDGHSARFQHTGRDKPDGQKRDGDRSAPEPTRGRDKPAERPRAYKPELQQENVWTASRPAQEGYFIDPITNKRVPKPQQTGSRDGAGSKGADPSDPNPSTTIIHLGPGNAEAGQHAEHESLKKHQPPAQISPERSQQETATRKIQTPTPPGLAKTEKKNSKAVDLNPQPQATAKKATNGRVQDSLPSKNNESPVDTRVQHKTARMTGNYVQDFPEDFAETWKGTYRSETSVDKKPSAERLEPAINRIGGALAAGKPKGEAKCIERKTTHDELVEEIKDILADTAALDGMPAYLAIPERPGGFETSEKLAATADNQPKDTHPQPNLYKILVYDPHSQTVITTDATSVDPDEAGETLTLAQAVTRLSHPEAFLPHFATLEAQGYEVSSGGERTLVFCKRRTATEPGTVFLRGTRYASLPDPTGDASSPPVNPIDMMGSEPVVPSIGNFASPTGYVDYGERGARKARQRKPPPPFRDASEVHYKARGESGGKTRHGVLWRASVGAAWVAGLAYGGSVVGEYFATGGESGEGSRGTF